MHGFTQHYHWRGVKAAVVAVVAFSGAAFVVEGCQGHGQDNVAGSGVGAQPPASTSSFHGSDVVATVNGDSVTAGELYDALQHYIPTHIANFPNNPELNQPAGQEALKNLIISAVTVQFAKSSGTPVTDSQLKDYYNDQLMLQEAKITLPFETALLNQGYTVDSYKQEVLAPQLAQFNVMEKAEKITPGDIQAQYNTTQAQYTIPARVHVHRIVSATRQDAQNVYSGIKAGRPMSDFAGVSLAAGDGGNPADNTDLATWLDAGLASGLGKTVSAQLFKAKTGDLLQPVSVQGRWWVMQVVDTKPSQPLPFDQVKDLVRINLIRARSGAAAQDVQQQIVQALHSAQIKIDLPQYQGVAMEVHMAGLASPSQPAPAAASSGAQGKKK